MKYHIKPGIVKCCDNPSIRAVAFEIRHPGGKEVLKDTNYYCENCWHDFTQEEVERIEDEQK